jgi:hypothetical protein
MHSKKIALVCLIVLVGIILSPYSINYYSERPGRAAIEAAHGKVGNERYGILKYLKLSSPYFNYASYIYPESREMDFILPLDNPDIYKLKNIKSVRATKQRLGAEEFRDLSNFPKLTALYLSNCEISDHDLRALPMLYHLQEIDLSGCDIGDRSVKNIMHLRDLSKIILNRTHLTDSGLLEIASLPKLEMVCVRGTSVSLDCVNMFKKYSARFWTQGP